MRTRQAEAERRSAGLPLLGAASLPSGRVEMRGDRRAQAMCLRVEGEPVRCTNGPWGTNLRTGSFVIGGRWYVVVASHRYLVDVQLPRGPSDDPFAPGDPIEGGGPLTPAPEVGGIPIESTGGQEALPWRVALARPPADLDQVWARGGDTAGPVLRPPF